MGMGMGEHTDVQPEPSEPANDQRWFASQQSLQGPPQRAKIKVSQPSHPPPSPHTHTHTHCRICYENPHAERTKHESGILMSLSNTCFFWSA